MNTLIDNLLSVEDEASAIIEKAHVEAKEVDKQTTATIESIKKEIAEAVEKKYAAFREEALRKHEEEAAKQQEEARAMIDKAGHVPAEVISKQADKIVARFREI